MSTSWHFPFFVLASFITFLWILWFVTRKRVVRPGAALVLGVSAIVVVGGMVFAKFGHGVGWPWWVYYTVPALATLVLPPIAFRLSVRESTQYLVLAFVSSPAIHVAFSLFLGWYEYMPFIRAPSLASLLGHGAGI